MFFSHFLIILLNSVLTLAAINNSDKTEQNHIEEGVNDEKIISGRDAVDGERPFQVVLLSDGKFICGGSLVQTPFLNGRVVVTAAHCVVSGNGNFTIRYNTLRRSTGPTIDVIRAIPHERYNPLIIDNDIAILILSSRFQNGINARAIRILPKRDPIPGSTVTVSGWGRTSLPRNGNPPENLQIANLNVVQRSTCNNIWSGYITSNMICASDSTRSTCFGDSGGPLTQNGFLIGVVSFGTQRCFDPNIPNVYTRVGNYYSWIIRTIIFNIRQ